MQNQHQLEALESRLALQRDGNQGMLSSNVAGKLQDISTNTATFNSNFGNFNTGIFNQLAMLNKTATEQLNTLSSIQGSLGQGFQQITDAIMAASPQLKGANGASMWKQSRESLKDEKAAKKYNIKTSLANLARVPSSLVLQKYDTYQDKQIALLAGIYDINRNLLKNDIERRQRDIASGRVGSSDPEKGIEDTKLTIRESLKKIPGFGTAIANTASLATTTADMILAPIKPGFFKQKMREIKSSLGITDFRATSEILKKAGVRGADEQQRAFDFLGDAFPKYLEDARIRDYEKIELLHDIAQNISRTATFITGEKRDFNETKYANQKVKKHYDFTTGKFVSKEQFEENKQSLSDIIAQQIDTDKGFLASFLGPHAQKFLKKHKKLNDFVGVTHTTGQTAGKAAYDIADITKAEAESQRQSAAYKQVKSNIEDSSMISRGIGAVPLVLALTAAAAATGGLAPAMLGGLASTGGVLGSLGLGSILSAASANLVGKMNRAGRARGETGLNSSNVLNSEDIINYRADNGDLNLKNFMEQNSDIQLNNRKIEERTEKAKSNFEREKANGTLNGRSEQDFIDEEVYKFKTGITDIAQIKADIDEAKLKYNAKHKFNPLKWIDSTARQEFIDAELVAKYSTTNYAKRQIAGIDAARINQVDAIEKAKTEQVFREVEIQKAIDKFKLENPTLTGKKLTDKLFEVRRQAELDFSDRLYDEVNATGDTVRGTFQVEEAAPIDVQADKITKIFGNKSKSRSSAMLGNSLLPLQLLNSLNNITLTNIPKIARNQLKNANTATVVGLLQIRSILSEMDLKTTFVSLESKLINIYDELAVNLPLNIESVLKPYLENLSNGMLAYSIADEIGNVAIPTIDIYQRVKDAKDNATPYLPLHTDLQQQLLDINTVIHAAKGVDRLNISDIPSEGIIVGENGPEAIKVDDASKKSNKKLSILPNPKTMVDSFKDFFSKKNPLVESINRLKDSIELEIVAQSVTAENIHKLPKEVEKSNSKILDGSHRQELAILADQVKLYKSNIAELMESTEEERKKELREILLSQENSIDQLAKRYMEEYNVKYASMDKFINDILSSNSKEAEEQATNQVYATESVEEAITEESKKQQTILEKIYGFINKKYDDDKSNKPTTSIEEVKKDAEAAAKKEDKRSLHEKLSSGFENLQKSIGGKLDKIKQDPKKAAEELGLGSMILAGAVSWAFDTLSDIQEQSARGEKVNIATTLFKNLFTVSGNNDILSFAMAGSKYAMIGAGVGATVGALGGPLGIFGGAFAGGLIGFGLGIVANSVASLFNESRAEGNGFFSSLFYAMFGSDGSSLFSSMGKYAIYGAILGNTAFPLIGSIPGALIGAGLGIVVESISGLFNESRKEGNGFFSSVFYALFGSDGDSVFSTMGKYALYGAGIGTVTLGPVFGTIAGGVLGAGVGFLIDALSGLYQQSEGTNFVDKIWNMPNTVANMLPLGKFGKIFANNFADWGWFPGMLFGSIMGSVVDGIIGFGHLIAAGNKMLANFREYITITHPTQLANEYLDGILSKSLAISWASNTSYLGFLAGAIVGGIGDTIVSIIDLLTGEDPIGKIKEFLLGKISGLWDWAFGEDKEDGKDIKNAKEQQKSWWERTKDTWRETGAAFDSAASDINNAFSGDDQFAKLDNKGNVIDANGNIISDNKAPAVVDKAKTKVQELAKKAEPVIDTAKNKVQEVMAAAPAVVNSTVSKVQEAVEVAPAVVDSTVSKVQEVTNQAIPAAKSLVSSTFPQELSSENIEESNLEFAKQIPFEQIKSELSESNEASESTQATNVTSIVDKLNQDEVDSKAEYEINANVVYLRFNKKSDLLLDQKTIGGRNTDFKSFLVKILGTTVESVFNGIENMASFAGIVMDFWKEIGGKLKDFVMSLLPDSVKKALNWVGDQATAAADAVSNSAAGQAIGGVVDTVANSAIGQAVGDVPNKVQAAYKGVKAGAIEAGQSGDIGKAWEATEEGYRKNLGVASSTFEGKIGTVSMDTNKRYAYGKYQFNAESGLNDFFKASPEYAKKFAGLSPESPEFNALWKSEAKNNPEAFEAAQQKAAQAIYYDPTKKVAEKYGFDTNNGAVQEFLMSAAVQHGKGGAASILKRAAAQGGDLKSLSAKQQSDLLYENRAKFVSGISEKRLSAKQKEQQYSRYKQEQAFIQAKGLYDYDSKKEAEKTSKSKSDTTSVAQSPVTVNPQGTDVQRSSIMLDNKNTNEIPGNALSIAQNAKVIPLSDNIIQAKKIVDADNQRQDYYRKNNWTQEQIDKAEVVHFQERIDKEKAAEEAKSAEYAKKMGHNFDDVKASPIVSNSPVIANKNKTDVKRVPIPGNILAANDNSYVPQIDSGSDTGLLPKPKLDKPFNPLDFIMGSAMASDEVPPMETINNSKIINFQNAFSQKPNQNSIAPQTSIQNRLNETNEANSDKLTDTQMSNLRNEFSQRIKQPPSEKNRLAALSKSIETNTTSIKQIPEGWTQNKDGSYGRIEDFGSRSMFAQTSVSKEDMLKFAQEDNINSERSEIAKLKQSKGAAPGYEQTGRDISTYETPFGEDGKENIKTGEKIQYSNGAKEISREHLYSKSSLFGDSDSVTGEVATWDKLKREDPEAYREAVGEEIYNREKALEDPNFGKQSKLSESPIVSSPIAEIDKLKKSEQTTITPTQQLEVYKGPDKFEESSSEVTTQPYDIGKPIVATPFSEVKAANDESFKSGKFSVDQIAKMRDAQYAKEAENSKFSKDDQSLFSTYSKYGHEKVGDNVYKGKDGKFYDKLGNLANADGSMADIKLHRNDSLEGIDQDIIDQHSGVKAGSSQSRVQKMSENLDSAMENALPGGKFKSDTSDLTGGWEKEMTNLGSGSMLGSIGRATSGLSGMISNPISSISNAFGGLFDKVSNIRLDNSIEKDNSLFDKPEPEAENIAGSTPIAKQESESIPIIQQNNMHHATTGDTASNKPFGIESNLDGFLQEMFSTAPGTYRKNVENYAVRGDKIMFAA